jgi:acyl-CoA thioesterase FadM
LIRIFDYTVAREEIITSLGISPASIVSTGNAMALSELNLKYFTPLRVIMHKCNFRSKSVKCWKILKVKSSYICVQRGARFVVTVRVVQIKGARILVEHLIETLPDREVMYICVRAIFA